MSKSLLNSNVGYIVYITANKRRKTAIGLTNQMNNSRIKISQKCSRLVYFKKFRDKNKAMHKKKFLEQKDKVKINELISDFNPEWLDLIFMLQDNIDSN